MIKKFTHKSFVTKFFLLVIATLFFVNVPSEMQQVQAATKKYSLTVEGAESIGIVKSLGVEDGKIVSSKIVSIGSKSKVKAGQKIMVTILEDTDTCSFSDIKVISGDISIEYYDINNCFVFIMPESDVELEIISDYSPSETSHTLTISGGRSGSRWYTVTGTELSSGYEVWPWHDFTPTGGFYEPEQKVYIEADNPYTAQKRFKKWEVISGDITLEDETAYFTSFIMPQSDVEIKAVYEDIPKDGTKFTYKGNTYEVNYLQTYLKPEISGVVEATFIKAKKDVKNLVIPRYVYCHGVKCEVTLVDCDNIAGSKTLTSVSIPASVYQLGSGTFKGCTNLKKVVIKHTNNISLFCLYSDGAFRNISKDAVIYVKKKALNEYKKYIYNPDWESSEPVIDKTTKIEAIK